MRPRGAWIVLAVTLVYLVGGGAPAVAWTPAGHMTLGAIAYRELERIDPQALHAVLELLSHHPHYEQLLAIDQELDPADRPVALFARAARWADDVRDEPYEEYSRPAWHYVDFRYRPPGELYPPRGPEQDGYLLWALQENVRRLQSDSDTVRAVALTWLFHLVTDIHQPLHNVALVDAAHPDGDRGGNLSFVRVRAGADTVNLHWLWDGLIQRSDDPAETLARARELGADTGLSASELQRALAVDDFRAWSEEGARIAVESVYLGGTLATGPEDDGTVLPSDYLDNARRVARQRGVLGALRLAHLLARLF